MIFGALNIFIVLLIAILALLAWVAFRYRNLLIGMRADEKKFRLAFDLNPSPMLITIKESGVIVDANKTFSHLIGLKVEAVLGLSTVDLGIFESHEERDEKIFALLKDPAGSYIDHTFKVRDDIQIEVAIGVATFSKGGIDFLLVVMNDITENKRAAELMKHMANHDVLTGLPNRRRFSEIFDLFLRHAQSRKEKGAILFIDLDGFKNINDNYGHDVGDKVLQIVARRFSNAVRTKDVLARVGGDEFILFVENQNTVDSVKKIASKIISCLDAEIGGVTSENLKLGCSIGVSLYPEHGQDAITLLKMADEAMYDAKRNGRGKVFFANP